MKRNLQGVVAISLLMAGINCVQAACPDPNSVASYLADFSGRQLSKGFPEVASVEEAYCAQGHLVELIPHVLGRRVGYKAGFTNPAMFAVFGVTGPAYGVMFEKMMVESGAKLPAKFGVRPLFEADFVAIVKDEGLADAQSPLEALEHIESFVPFIELPDLMLDTQGAPQGAALIAVNMGFRGGALGAPVPAIASQSFLERLANMTVVMTEERSGKVLGTASGKVIMGNPANSALWLAKALRNAGIRVQKGDVLSLGGYIPPTPTVPNTIINVQYFGLPGDPSVSVEFE